MRMRRPGVAMLFPVLVTLAIAAAGALLSYGIMRGEFENRIYNLEMCVQPMQRDVSEIKETMAEMRSDVRWLRRERERER